MIKKLLTYALVVTTAVWSLGLLATPLAVGAASTGDLVKLDCAAKDGICDAVYYIGTDGRKYVFPNEGTYSTWYTGFGSVKKISQVEMSAYPSGGFVTVRPGARVIQIGGDSSYYVVSGGGKLHSVTEAQAAEIYGSDWKTTSLVSMNALNSYYYTMNPSPIPALGSASDYDKAAEMDASATIDADKALSDSSPISTGSSVTVSLAPDSPASGIVVGGAADVAFTKINLTASADGDIIIDNWGVVRGGLGNDAAFASVDILDGATMLPINDSGKTFNSEHVANFTDDFTIPAGTTRSVYLAGNMASQATMASYAGEVPALGLKTLTLKGSSSISGSLPIFGNYQTTNATITIGTATVSRGAYTNSTSTLEVGKTNYTMFSFQVANSSAEEAQFSSVKVYQSGSASLANDLANIKLYQDGTEIANGVVSGNYVTFTFSPITLTKGQTKQFLVKADVVDGSARTIQLGLYRSTNLLLKGLTYGYNITPTYSGTGSSSNNPVLSDNTFTISAGSLRVGRANTIAAGNITIGADQTIGAFEFQAKGEPTTITALTLTITSSTSGTITEDAFKSVKLVDAAGKTVAGPTDITNNALTVAFTDTFTVPTGTSVYKVVGTLDTNGGWTTNDTIYASVTPSAITAKGETTGLTITPSPASSISTVTQTVKTATLTVAKNSTPTDKNVIVNSTGVLIGSWNFDASNSGENIRVTSISVRASTTGALNNLTLKDGSTILLPVNDNPVTYDGDGDATATSTFALSEPLIITKGTSKNLDLYADIGSNSAAGEVDAWGITSSAAITAYGVTTGNAATVTVTANDGALVTTTGAGTLAVNVNGIPGQLLVAGTTGVTLTNVNLKATNEPIDVTKLTVRIGDGGLEGTAAGDYTQISKIYLKIDGSVVGNADGYAVAAATKQINLERGALTIPATDDGKDLVVLGDIVSMGTNQPGTANADIVVGLSGQNGFTATGNGSNTTATFDYNSSTGSAMIIHKAVPQVVIETPTNKLAATASLQRTKITAVGNKIGVYKLSFVTTTSTGVNLTNGYIKLASSCGSLSSGTVLSAATPAGTDIGAGIKTWGLKISNALNTTKYYLDINKDSTCSIDFYATIGTTSNVDTVSTSLLGDTATSTTNHVAGAEADTFVTNDQGNFVWSDLNADQTQTAGSLTASQWYNGYLVEGLGSTSTSTPVTVGE
ncbi:MAG: hypothetical protein JW816_01915 [Candidatus Buchananbacteria bacterium]|nr:hypothetical protein [Candidatus Buchananbacteria bacterium]